MSIKKLFLFVVVLSNLGFLHLSAFAEDDAKQEKSNQDANYKTLELFQKVLHFVETNYVDPVEKNKLVRGAIKGIMDTLDPHSNFLPPDVFRDMKVDTSGKFGGVGIEVGMVDNVLTVVAPIEDTPAWKAGIRPNDRIVKIDGESTKGLSISDAVSKMRGKKGSKIQLSIYRDGFTEMKDMSLTRDLIKIRSVRYELLEPEVGYIRLSTFNENASDDIEKAIRKLEDKQPIKGLVLDLRTNPGGLLDEAVDVTSMFVDEGVVVSTMGRHKDQKEVRNIKTSIKARKDFAMAVLVNSSSASASEIVAGALQDHKRAIILGQPTFGKGSVQTVIDLGNDMGLKLTIARYYTPSGRSIQEKGVMPDIILDEFDPKLLSQAKISRKITREKDLKGHMVNDQESKNEFAVNELKAIGSMKKNDSSDSEEDNKEALLPIEFKPKEDYQVQAAVNYLKSFEVFKKITQATTQVTSQ